MNAKKDKTMFMLICVVMESIIELNLEHRREPIACSFHKANILVMRNGSQYSTKSRYFAETSNKNDFLDYMLRLRFIIQYQYWKSIMYVT